jgi:hypothetical protein
MVRACQMDILYFDLETQRTANDVGGWDRKHQMGMSVGVIYSTAADTYEIYSESRAGDLVARLRRADLVVGYNILRFDYEVLMGYTILDLPHYLPTLDLLPHVERAAGHRLKLEELAQGTLGVGKVAEGLDAIRWWREGKVMEIAEYCCFDVKVTRLVHEHGARHGELFYSDRFGRKQRMEIDWKRGDG